MQAPSDGLLSMSSADFIISGKLWRLFPKIKILSSTEHSDQHVKQLRLAFTIFFGVSFAAIKTLARLSVTSVLIFLAKAYVIRTLLLRDWSVQQTATKPQTQ